MKIDKIKVKGVYYDINLPTDATPSITSLTLSGGLTVDGTSNLAAVNINSVLKLNYDLPTTDFSSSSSPLQPHSNYYLLLERDSFTSLASPVVRSICKSQVEFKPLY